MVSSYSSLVKYLFAVVAYFNFSLVLTQISNSTLPVQLILHWSCVFIQTAVKLGGDFKDK